MDKKETINYLFEQIRGAGLCKTQRDFAALLGINEKGFSAAMNGNEKYLTDSLERKVKRFQETHFSDDGGIIYDAIRVSDKMQTKTVKK